MARDIFRRRWFPQPRRNVGLGVKNATFTLDSVVCTADVGTFSETIDCFFNVTGVAAIAQLTSPTPQIEFTLTGDEATSAVGTLVIGQASSLVGQEATTEVTPPSLLIDTNPSLTGVSAAASVGTIVGDHPSRNLTGVQVAASTGTPLGDHPTIPLIGVSATAVSQVITPNRVFRMPGFQVVASCNGDTWNIFKSVNLVGVHVNTLPSDDTVYYPAGGGGGGAAGLFGDGEDGEDGSAFGIGGYGGAADGFVVPRQLTPGADGNNGTEFDGIIGDGSGAGGGSWNGTGIGQDGGKGGLYGGGGGGGGGGRDGGGQGGEGADGIVYIEYVGDSGLVKIILDKNSESPWCVPADWSGTNKIILVGPGGCGSDGTGISGGDGGFGGDTVGVENTLVFNPGDLIPFTIPSAPCSEAATVFSVYYAAPGANGGPGGGGGASGGGSAGFPGGIVKTGGKGGPGGRLSTLRIAPLPPVDSVFATAEVGSFSLGGVPGDRTFIIGAIEQVPLPPGIVLLPTSEDIVLGTDPYVIGSSQYYTIGEVHWDSALKIQGVDWEFVDPFKHIIHLLTPPAPSTVITLIYYRWNIGVRAGFKVNSYPVPFAFTGTTIVAERVPLENKFFTVEYTSVRPGDNPRSMFAIFPNMVDDLLVQHDQYDGANGFQTYRPVNYTVYDSSLNEVWKWDGSSWFSLGAYAPGTQFYVKRLKQVYEYDGVVATAVYTAGDGASIIPQVLTYPPFGESIGKNFLIDAFSPSASVDYPSAYEVAQSPGDYDPWLPGL